MQALPAYEDSRRLRGNTQHILAKTKTWWFEASGGVEVTCDCPETWLYYMGGCQNYGPFLGTLNIRCRIIIGTQKGTIILTTAHMGALKNSGSLCRSFFHNKNHKVLGLGFRGLGFRV